MSSRERLPSARPAVRVPVYRGMKRNDAELMSALPKPLGRHSAVTLVEVDRKHLAAGARVLARVEGKVLHAPLGEMMPELLRRTAAVRRLGSYDKARSNLALHPVEREGFSTHAWAESQLELAHMREMDRERRFAWYDTQRLVVYWPMPGDRCIWHVPDIAAVDVDGQPWLLDVKNSDALKTSGYVRAQLMLTAATCAHFGWGFRLLSDMSRRRAANLSMLRRFYQLSPELDDQVRAALRGRSTHLGGVIADADGRPAGQAVALHLLAQGLLDTDLDRSLEDSTPVTWPGWQA